MFIVFFSSVFFWICVISNTEKYMPEQFIKQKSLMGLNLICRNCSSIIGIKQIATTLCKEKSSLQEALTLLTNADRSTDNKRNPFLGCLKQWGGGDV